MDESSIGLTAAIVVAVAAVAIFALTRGRLKGGKSMTKDVKVEAFDDPAGGIDWEIDGRKAKQSSLQFPKGSQDVQVDFRLKDKTAARGLRFNRSDPIWVHETNAAQCPPAGSSDAQIQFLNCTDDVLTVINTNAKNSTLRYQLNFLNNSSGDEPCDPEIKNGGR
jgi:hypothetical protein